MHTHTYRAPQINDYVQDVDVTGRNYVEHFGVVETFHTPIEGTLVHVDLMPGGMILGLASHAAAQGCRRSARRTTSSGGCVPRGWPTRTVTRWRSSWRSQAWLRSSRWSVRGGAGWGRRRYAAAGCAATLAGHERQGAACDEPTCG